MDRRDFIGIAPYAAILLVNILLFYEALQIAPVSEGRIGADVWPKAILVLAMVTCLWEIGRKLSFSAARIRRDRGGTVDKGSLIPREKPAHDTPEVGRLTPWMGIALTAAYVFSFPWLGYFLATFLYVSAFIYLGGYRRAAVAAGVGAVASLAFMFLFMRVVYVSLPIGVWPFSQVSTFLMRAMGIQ